MNEVCTRALAHALIVVGLLAGFAAAPASGQDSGGRRQVTTRTFSGGGRWGVADEARRRPPLMPWQRTLEDALALSQATGKPLLVCVNADGEPASESLAWNRYRDPEFAALAEGFVPVLASPNRRQPRDRDERGRRLPDARFGRLLNSEHIDIEPLLFERYFEGRRVAPRHVGVSPDGEILFDLFLLQDLSAVDRALREHGVFGQPVVDPTNLSEAELLGSPDAARRAELEARFLAADERGRTRLAGLALSGVRATQHPELLHLALVDPSVGVRRQAVWSILQQPTHVPVALVPRAWELTKDDPELRRTFLGALGRAVETADAGTWKDNAAFYLRVYSSLHEPSRSIDVERWRLALALTTSAPAPAPTADDFDATTAVLEDLEAALRTNPDDVELLVQDAAARMRLARIKLATGGNPSFFLEDVIAAAGRVLDVAPDEGRALGYLAWASYLLADVETAADVAARALPHLLRDAASPLAAEVLNVFATVRARALYDAMNAGEAWGPEVIPDLRAAYEVLLAHPTGTEPQWRAYLDLLGTLRAHDAQGELLRRAVERFPLSGDMHLYLRYQVLRDEGARALEAAYEDSSFAGARADHGPEWTWFHGLATLVAAEQDVTNGDEPAAVEAYLRSEQRFVEAAAQNPEFEGSSAHYRCLAMAGAARLLARAGEHRAAVDTLVEAVRIAPGSARMPDGFDRTPADAALEIARHLEAAGAAELQEELKVRLTEAGLGVPTASGPRTDG